MSENNDITFDDDDFILLDEVIINPYETKSELSPKKMLFFGALLALGVWAVLDE